VKGWACVGKGAGGAGGPWPGGKTEGTIVGDTGSEFGRRPSYTIEPKDKKKWGRKTGKG